MKHEMSIMESLKKDHNLVTTSPAALKHFSASTEDGERVFRQVFNFFSTLGLRFYVVSMWNGACMHNAHSQAVTYAKGGGGGFGGQPPPPPPCRLEMQ